MRTLEWLMVVLSVPAVSWMLFVRRRWPIWVCIPTVAALVLLPVHAWIEGAHWQMVPIYLGILLLLYPLLRNNSIAGRGRLIVGGVSAFLLIAGLMLCYALPMFHLPRTTGNYPVGTRTMFLVDPNRMESHPGAPHIPREVTIQIWYPSATSKGRRAVYRLRGEADLRSTYQTVLKTDSLQDTPAADGRFPVVIFNHSWRGFRNRSTYIMQELASHGFIVVGVSHPWNAALVQLHDGRVADGLSQPDLGNFHAEPPMTYEQRMALADTEMRVQVDDDKFVLDELAKRDQVPSDPFYSRLDLAHTGAFGHSFGGAVSAELAKEDQRVISVVLLDGVLQGPIAETGLNKPLFRIKANTPEMPPGSELSPDLNTRVHALMAINGERSLAESFYRFGGEQVVINGIVHENFTDKGFFSPFHRLSGIGFLPQQRAATIINSYLVAWFQQTLKNQPQPLLSDEKPPFPEVLRFQIWPSPAKQTP